VFAPVENRSRFGLSVMSTQSQATTDDCKHCGDKIDVFYTPGYCSEDCFYIHKGRKALNQVESDHTICATCHTPIKTIEKPPESVSLNIPPSDHTQSNGLTENVLIGYQYQTEHTKRYDDAQGAGANAIFYTRWSCDCGTVNPNERDDILETVDLNKTVRNLCERLYDLCEKDAIGGSFSHTRFLERFSKQERNFAESVGYGLYG